MTSRSSTTSPAVRVAIDVAKLSHQVLLELPNGRRRVLRVANTKTDIDRFVTMLGALEQPWMTSADVDGDGKAELLLPQRNFLRAVLLKADEPDATNKTWSFTVKDQINGAANNSRLVGATTIRKFARIARELAASGEGRRALDALETISVRAYWERLDDEARREIASISDAIAITADETARLHVIGSIDPIGRERACCITSADDRPVNCESNWPPP